MSQKLTSLKRTITFSDFQDGAAVKHDGERSLLYSLSMIARGNNINEVHREKSMNDVRHSVGLYMDFPLANGILARASRREAAFKNAGAKQMNHVRGTDGWWRSMLVVEVRAIDNYLYPWVFVCLNALLATILSEVAGLDMSHELLQHWDTVYSLVLKTSLAFLLVFRLNRCAMRYWEARGLWGSVTHNTRNLVGGILMYCSHSPRNRDQAIKWASSFCVAAMHFIRIEHEYNPDELAGFLSRANVSTMQDANHAPLYAASMTRHYLRKAFKIDAQTPPQLAHAYAIQMNNLEQYVSQLVAQVSGMEKIRSTPLPIAYVSHLRTILFAYCLLLPYVWVDEWKWATVPLVAFTAFALFGIEGASSEVEIPFDRHRPNHLAMDAYCLIILDSVMGLVVHDANLELQGQKEEDYNSEDSDDDADLEGDVFNT